MANDDDSITHSLHHLSLARSLSSTKLLSFIEILGPNSSYRFLLLSPLIIYCFPSTQVCLNWAKVVRGQYYISWKPWTVGTGDVLENAFTSTRYFVDYTREMLKFRENLITENACPTRCE